jgi:peroxin-10
MPINQFADLKYFLSYSHKLFTFTDRNSPENKNWLTTFCRYQILGIFLLIQLCILGAERLRRSNISSIASSINQISSGSYPSTAGALVLNLSIFLALMLNLEFYLLTSYNDINICLFLFFVFVNDDPGRGVPILNEDGHVISDIRGGKAADVASHPEVFALSYKR